MPLDTQLQPLPPRGSANLGSVSGDIYRDLVIPEWPGQAPQQARGQAGPNAALLRLGLEEQENDQIRQLAQQYGDDPDELVRQIARINPKRAYEIGEQFNKSQKEGAEFHLQRTKAAREELQSRLSVLQGADATNWDAVTSGIVKDYPQLTPLFAGRPYSDDFKQQILNVGRSQDQWLDAQEKAATDMLDEKKQLAAARLIVAADTPQKQAELQGLAKQGGFTRLLGMFDPQSAQAFIEQAEKANPAGATKGGQHIEGMYQGKRTFGVFDPNTNTFNVDGKQVSASEFRPIPPQSAMGGGGGGAAASQSDAVRGYMNDLISGASKLTDVPAAGGMRNAVRGRLEREGYDLNKPLTAQAQARVDLAKMVLPQVNAVRELGRKINALGLMGTIGGRWRSVVSGESAADSLSGLTTEQKRLVGQFVSQAELLSTGAAMTHFGARASGGAVENMRQQFDPRNKSLDTYLGNLDAVQAVLGDYAKGLPGATNKNTSTPEELRKRYGY